MIAVDSNISLMRIAKTPHGISPLTARLPPSPPDGCPQGAPCPSNPRQRSARSEPADRPTRPFTIS
jgi:hypothetical protein